MAQMPLHDLLCNVIGAPFSDENDSDHCYFNPPASLQLHYPCMIYRYMGNVEIFADNKKYIRYKQYVLTYITEDPDTKVADKISDLKYCKFDRAYTSDGLHHFVYTLCHNGPRIKEEKE